MITTPDFFAANMALLRDHHPHLWQKITDTPPEALGHLCHTQNGSLNLTVSNQEGQEIFLHQAADPESCAADFLSDIPPDYPGLVAILGMGLGYGLAHVLAQRPLLQHLAVLELEPGIFIQALKHVDLAPLLSDRRLILGIGKELEVSEVLAPAFCALHLEDSRISHHRPSFALNPAGYQALQEQLFAYLNLLKVAGTTTKVSGLDFFNNRFKHLATIHHHFLLEELSGVFAGVPAILVAGGPSLDQNIHLLKEAQHKAVILAADTVLPALLNNAVSPHFLTAIDPSNLAYEKFAEVIPQIKNTALICSSWVNPKTPRNFPNQQIFWTFAEKPVEAWINQLLGGRICIGGASTVAHLNLYAAYILGCDPIIFVGQDLAYPQTASHAAGVVLQGCAPIRDSARPDEPGTGPLVRGVDGTMLRTDLAFLSMKKFFELVIAKSPQKHLNATEGGAHLEGTTALSLRAALDQHCVKEIDADSRIQKHLQTSSKIDPQRLLAEFDHILKKIKKLQRNIAVADKLCGSAQKELATLVKSRKPLAAFNDLPRGTQQKLHQIELLHQEQDKATELWVILEEITIKGKQQSQRDQLALAALSNGNDPALYPKWLRQSLRRLLKINEARQEALALLAENINKTISFHRQENHFLSKIALHGVNQEQNLLALAGFYGERENYSLARPILEKLQKTRPLNAEMFFFLGCIKAMRAEFAKSAACFRQAIALAPKLASKVDDFQRKNGDEFLAFLGRFQTAADRSRPVFTWLLKKGLSFAPQHRRLLDQLTAVIARDLKLGQLNPAADCNQEEAQHINSWYDFLTKQAAELSAKLDPELISQVYLKHGNLLLKENNYAAAKADFVKGLKYFPENRDLHRCLIDTLFATGDFSGAIAALDQAISIDDGFSAYWEIIGDSLAAGGQNEDAVLAYERCFRSWPENIGLLKKIGDCYLASGQLEAAREAYLQLKSRLP